MNRGMGELLGLCAYGPKLSERTVGGVSEINCGDVMHALGAVQAPEVGKRLVRMKYLLEDQRQSLLECYLLDHGAKRAASERWGPQMTQVMTEVLNRYLGPEACISCNGNGERLVETRVVSCTVCGGSGRPLPIPRNAHGDRVAWLLGLCRDWESQVLGAMARKLRLPEEPEVGYHDDQKCS